MSSPTAERAWPSAAELDQALGSLYSAHTTLRTVLERAKRAEGAALRPTHENIGSLVRFEKLANEHLDSIRDDLISIGVVGDRGIEMTAPEHGMF